MYLQLSDCTVMSCVEILSIFYVRQTVQFTLLYRIYIHMMWPYIYISLPGSLESPALGSLDQSYK
jgi:hypothetical protein